MPEALLTDRVYPSFEAAWRQRLANTEQLGPKVTLAPALGWPGNFGHSAVAFALGKSVCVLAQAPGPGPSMETGS